ncbi:TPA: hypothetical protein ACKR1W_001108 [Proteus mirabilis]|uniref:hypothetical protein n=1 Tax=Proteus mirabilis TaxID=584 RepID=UPI0034D65573
MLIYFFIGCTVGALIYFLRNKRHQGKKNSLSIIPFLGFVFAAGNYLFFSRETDRYLQGEDSIVNLISCIAFAVILLFAYGISTHIAHIGEKAIKNYHQLQSEGNSKFSALINTIFISLLLLSLSFSLFFDQRLFFLSFVLMFVYQIAKRTPEKRFLRFQKILATSKIRSLAIGLVEIKGKITAGKILNSRLGKKECYGYFYYEYDISRDKEGKKSYHQTFCEKKISNFTMTDDTGSIEVIVEDKPFVRLGIKPHQDLESNNKRFKEYILSPDTTYLLIGSAQAINDQVVITRSAPHYLLGLSPQEYVVHWNKARPLRRNLIITVIIALFVIFSILVIPMDYQNGILTLYFNTSGFPR